MLNWDFTKRIGYVDVERGSQKERWNIYQGNAFAIMCWENDTQYQLMTFWADEQHAKNCLGLTRGYSNLYNYDKFEFYLDGNYDVCFKIAKLLKRAKVHFTLDY